MGPAWCLWFHSSFLPTCFGKVLLHFLVTRSQVTMARYGLILGQRKVNTVGRTSPSLAIATANKKQLSKKKKKTCDIWDSTFPDRWKMSPPTFCTSVTDELATALGHRQPLLNLCCPHENDTPGPKCLPALLHPLFPLSARELKGDKLFPKCAVTGKPVALFRFELNSTTRLESEKKILKEKKKAEKHPPNLAIIYCFLFWDFLNETF